MNPRMKEELNKGDKVKLMNLRIKEELNKGDKVKLMNPRIKEDLNKGYKVNYDWKGSVRYSNRLISEKIVCLCDGLELHGNGTHFVGTLCFLCD